MNASPIGSGGWPAGLVRLVEGMTGEPFPEVGWRELVRVRDAVERALNAEANRRQSPPSGDAA